MQALSRGFTLEFSRPAAESLQNRLCLETRYNWPNLASPPVVKLRPPPMDYQLDAGSAHRLVAGDQGFNPTMQCVGEHS